MLKFSEIVSFVNINLWRKLLNEINYWMDVCPSCQGPDVTWEPEFYAQDLAPITISLMPMGRGNKRVMTQPLSFVFFPLPGNVACTQTTLYPTSFAQNWTYKYFIYLKYFKGKL